MQHICFMLRALFTPSVCSLLPRACSSPHSPHNWAHSVPNRAAFLITSPCICIILPPIPCNQSLPPQSSPPHVGRPIRATHMMPRCANLPMSPHRTSPSSNHCT